MTALADRVVAWGIRWLQGGLVRRLWLVLASAAAVFGLGFGTLQAASVVAHEERTEVTALDVADLDSVAVDNGAGSVDVIGVTGADEVTVRARISDGLRDTGHEIATRDGVLFVTGSCPVFGSEWCAVDYTIEVPADMYVDVRGRDGVSATDVTGGLTARSSTASIDLLRVGGDVTVAANQSRIEGDDLTAETVDASAAQGRITLDFVDSPRARDGARQPGTGRHHAARRARRGLRHRHRGEPGHRERRHPPGPGTATARSRSRPTRAT